MHAVILAAGVGARMHEITKESSKAMIRLAGMTVIERLVLSLTAAGCTKITVGCGWHSDEMIELLSGLGFGESLTYIRVQNYQAGPLQTLLSLLETVEEETFLACPVDYLVDPSLVSAFLSMFEEKKDASLYLAVDPEKTSGSKVYVRSGQEGLAQIGSRGQAKINGLDDIGISAMLLAGKTAMKKEFKNLLDSGAKSVGGALNELASSANCAHPILVTGFWCDLDTVNDFISVLPRIIDETSPRSNALLLKSGDTIEFGDTLTLHSGIVLENNVHLIGPVYIEECRIGSGSTIGPNVSVGAGTQIPPNCHIENSILYCNPRLEKGSRITYMIGHSTGKIFGDDQYAK